MALVVFSQSLEILDVFSSLNDSMTPWFYDLQHPKKHKNISGAWLDLQTQQEKLQRGCSKPGKWGKEELWWDLCNLWEVPHTMPSTRRVTPSSGEHLECCCLFLAQPLAWCYTNNITDLFFMLQGRASWVSWRDFMVQKELWAFFPIF